MDSSTDNNALARNDGVKSPGAKRSGRARVTRSLIAFGGFLALAYLAGFLRFVTLIAHDPIDTATVSPAEGIVALTGGPERIAAAMALLAEDKASRLLISGVHPGVTRDDLKALIDDPSNKFDCCVDVGWRAENTIGNAEETAAWVAKKKFKSVIVVTSAYHMPRSLLELRRALPDAELHPFSVYQESVHLDRWWSYTGTTKLLFAEYTKYLLTLSRLRYTSDT